MMDLLKKATVSGRRLNCSIQLPFSRIEKGILYYVLNNEERQIATWNSDDTVCSVAVDCQEDILFEIIKSIYTLEGN